jgi:hypothetical protein
MALTKKLIAYASLALGIGLVVVGALMLNIPAGLIVCGVDPALHAVHA